MARPSHAHAIHGVVAGLLAGAVVALWFLVVDLAAGRPFHTPALLASTVIGGPVLRASVSVVLGYTALHLAVFAVLGSGATWLLEALKLAPGLLLGVLFGIGVLDSVYYGTLLLTDANVLGVLPAHHVLIANLLGGMALMAYLHRAERSEEPLGLGVLRHHPLVSQGLVTGLLGAGAVAFWFFLFDVAAGRPYYTPAALGSALFLGASGPDQVMLTAGVVAAYTAVHVLVFAAVGLALVWATERLERAPQFWLLGVLGFILLDALILGTLALLSQWVLGVLGFVAIAGANVVAVGAMGWWTWRHRPELRRAFAGAAMETRV
jgi:hypothetical protein